MKINFRKIKGFVHAHKISAIVIAVAVIVAIGATIYGVYFSNQKLNFPAFTPKEKTKEVKPVAPLTGFETDSDHATRRPFAVVIENHPDARPQSGYTKADVVYETLAEGGITRTLAIFQSQDSNEIGPVRSARLYFIDWLSEVGAIFSHVGGNIDALDEIAAKNIPDLNQFAYGNYYWRSTDRYAPHNVYTTTEKLISAAKKAGLAVTSQNLKWYGFKKDAETKDRPASQKVTVDFSTAQFVASWDYDPQTNEYSRSIAGVSAKDKATGEQVKAKNIIVQLETMSPMVTRTGEQGVKMATIGSGSGFLFQDGKATKITWKKTDRNSLTRLTDEAGNEIKLNPGQTWIEVAPLDAGVSY